MAGRGACTEVSHLMGCEVGLAHTLIQIMEPWEDCTVARELAGVTLAHLCSNVSNYWVRPAIDNTYSL